MNDWTVKFLKLRFYLLKSLLPVERFLINTYNKSFLPRFFKFIKFLFHSYGPDQFSILNIKENFKEILRLEWGDFLDSSRRGKVKRLTSQREKIWFKVKNFFLWGSFQNQVERAVYYTFMTFCIEIYNPMDKEILPLFWERKSELAKRAMEKIKFINGKKTAWPLIAHNIELFRRASILQKIIIEKMEVALKRQKKEPIVEDVKLALKSGLYPLLVTQGLSGTYWMRGSHHEIAGLFKPFDEEAFAPNNPIGPSMQGSLGQRRMRPGIRVGESIHREVAAFYVDQFFGFGIVPKTYYASFTHHVFFQALTKTKEQSLDLRRIVKTKLGSFQEFIEGFSSLNDTPKELWGKIPDIEFQLLVVLDVILGNMDRNTGNILISEDKIAAIDHGLVLPDINFHISDWYWSLEPGKKPLYPTLIELLENFPFDELGFKLKKHCFIDLPCLERLRERVILFREGVKINPIPAELKELLSDENLYLLKGFNQTLEEKAKQIAQKHFEKKKLS